MARKTTNARLGIIGGISILGTTGIVRPFSTASWRASVEQAISVLAAQGEDTVVLCTGGRTEKGAMKLFPQLPEVCFVEVGDFTGAALRRAAEHHLGRVIFAGMAGKLTKLARRADDPLHPVQGGPGPAGRHHESRRRPRGPGEQIGNANTARHAAELWTRPAAPGGRPRAMRPRRPRAEPVQRRGRRPGNQAPAGPGRHGRLHRPAEDRGVSRMNRGWARGSQHVTVIGCDGRPPGPDATKALAEAQTVIGAPRHLRAAPVPPHAEQLELRHLDEALDAIAAREGPTAVLASGDPGFFGIVRALRAPGSRRNVIPAVSSGRGPFRENSDWTGRCPGHLGARSAIRTEPRRRAARTPRRPSDRAGHSPPAWRETARRGKRALRVRAPRAPPRRRSAVLPAETGLADPNILISLDEHEHRHEHQHEHEHEHEHEHDTAGPPRLAGRPPGRPHGWALPEDAFEHRDSMITKPEVRALALARLGPAPGRTIWDVGAGSGSVAVECARFGAWVIAIESDPASARISAATPNRHHVRLRVHQAAPRRRSSACRRDRGLRRRRRPHRAGRRDPAASRRTVVVTLAAVQRVGETAALLAGRATGPKAPSSRPSAPQTAAGLGNHRLAAQNPVFVLWGQR